MVVVMSLLEFPVGDVGAPAFQQGGHVGREGRGEVHFLPRARMDEAEGAGVEGLAGVGVLAGGGDVGDDGGEVEAAEGAGLLGGVALREGEGQLVDGDGGDVGVEPGVEAVAAAGGEGAQEAGVDVGDHGAEAGEGGGARVVGHGALRGDGVGARLGQLDRNRFVYPHVELGLLHFLSLGAAAKQGDSRQRD